MNGVAWHLLGKVRNVGLPPVVLLLPPAFSGRAGSGNFKNLEPNESLPSLSDPALRKFLGAGAGGGIHLHRTRSGDFSGKSKTATSGTWRGFLPPGSCLQSVLALA